MTAKILSNLPCSVELPAGTGKTEIIADLAKEFTQKGNRALVLTHTHAGVDVLRRRMKVRNISSKTVTIRTLDSWCFELIRSFPVLADFTVGEDPDWGLTKEYHEAGTRATASAAIIRMLKISYDILIVDEYQDCQLHQHKLIDAISQSLPTCVFGDRMQGLFFFGGQSILWERDVLPVFPAVTIPIYPWRWDQTNRLLGEWLIEARDCLLDGRGIDLSSSPIVLHGKSQLINACKTQSRHSGTVVAICRFPHSAANLARRLGGTYSMIEELEGKHLKEFAVVVDGGVRSEVAAKCVEYAISCAYGVADRFSPTHRRKLRNGFPLESTRIPQFSRTFDALNLLLINPSFGNTRMALNEIQAHPNFRLHRREAWLGIMDALRLCEATSNLSLSKAVILVRNRLSVMGRRPEQRIVGRPLLIKGLEFDHAVLTDPVDYNAHELYVALTRGKTSVHVISDQMMLNPARPI